MRNRKLSDMLNEIPKTSLIWEEEHKIPWNDPAFSRRMLKEHLSQDHELASRPEKIVREQAQWILEFSEDARGVSILDLGCGPGLYAPWLGVFGNRYMGIDFGPASIEYAKSQFEKPGSVDFLLADVTSVPFGGPFELAMMLYGEINVFAPQQCARILAKAHEALAPGGRLLLEVQTFESVLEMGRGASWYKTRQGLFSDAPHLCLTESQWIEEERAARQIFHVIELEDAGLYDYCSVTKGWTMDELSTLLRDAGYQDAMVHESWPAHNEALRLVSAVKPSERRK